MFGLWLLAVASLLAGLSLGLSGFLWFALAPSALIIAVVATVILMNDNFGLAAAAAAIFGCIALNQIGYLIGIAVRFLINSE
jgi:hypothetical protein